MITEFILINTGNSTDGLSSAYQVTQLTGTGLAAVITTGGLLLVGAISMPQYQVLAPKPAAETQSVRNLPISGPGQSDDLADPAAAPFVGPLGIPRTHTQRAALLHQNYRIAPEESEYFNIPENLL